MKRKHRISILLLVGVSAFFAGRLATPRPVAWLRYVPANETIEMYRNGELAYELEPDDGILYEELKAIVTDTPKQPPAGNPTNSLLLAFANGKERQVGD
jgi:hypothetical protein